MKTNQIIVEKYITQSRGLITYKTDLLTASFFTLKAFGFMTATVVPAATGASAMGSVTLGVELYVAAGSNGMASGIMD